MDLTLQRRDDDGVAVVAASGEVDFATAPRLRDALVRPAMEGNAHLVADLSGVEFLDSVGLGVLVAVLKRVRSLGGDLHLVITSPRVLSVFELTGLNGVFAIHDDADAAVRAARAGAEA